MISLCAGLSILSAHPAELLIKDSFLTREIFKEKSEAVCLFEYQDTPQDRLFVALEISKLYAIFLTPEVHEGALYEILQQKGVWIQKKHYYHPVPTPLQIRLFTKALERELLNEFAKILKDQGWIYLNYDYGPTSAILELIFQEVGLDVDFYYLLPYKSHTHIYIHDEKITIYLNFKGPII
jgi:hypothetical protein